MLHYIIKILKSLYYDTFFWFLIGILVGAVYETLSYHLGKGLLW